MSEAERLRRESKRWIALANSVADPSIKTIMENLAVETYVIAAEFEAKQAHPANRAQAAW